MITRNTKLSNTMKEREDAARSDVADLKSQVAARTELAGYTVGANGEVGRVQWC